MYDFKSSPLLRERTDGERALTVPFMLVSVLLIIFAASFGQELLMMPVIVIAFGGRIMNLISTVSQLTDPDMIERELTALMQELAEEISGSAAGMLAQLFSTAVIIAATVVFCVCMERRSVRTMGLTRERALGRYGFGFAVGAVMFSLAYVLCLATGALSFEGVSGGVSVWLVLLLLVGYVIQGASEEILLRGFLLLSLSRRYSVALSVFTSSVFFALMHLGNAGVNMLGVFNIFLFGIFISLFTLRTGSLVGSCALHTAWNFVQGQVFGCRVSGIVSVESFFVTSTAAANAMTNGGDFGLEGGLAVTLVLLIATVCVCVLPSRIKGGDSDQTAI